MGHFPILLDGGDSHRGKSYFKFQNMWLRTYGFLEKVRHWELQLLSRMPKIVLAKKFKALKADLKNWNDLKFWNFDQRATT